MKVCVIIPVFNEQDFIKKSVESLIDHEELSLINGTDDSKSNV